MKDLREKLKNHIGHNVVCVPYGNKENPNDITIECEDCNEILISCETVEEDDNNSHQFNLPKTIGCHYCGSISRYLTSDLVVKQNHKICNKVFITCKKCGRRINVGEWTRCNR